MGYPVPTQIMGQVLWVWLMCCTFKLRSTLMWYMKQEAYGLILRREATWMRLRWSAKPTHPAVVHRRFERAWLAIIFRVEHELIDASRMFAYQSAAVPGVESVCGVWCARIDCHVRVAQINRSADASLPDPATGGAVVLNNRRNCISLSCLSFGVLKT